MFFFSPVSLCIGLRYLVAGRGNRLLSFLAWLSVSGMILGVALLIVVLSVMSGFDRELRERILGLSPHIMVYHRSGVHDWEQLAQHLTEDPRIVAVAPFAYLQGVLVHHNNNAAVLVRGVVPSAEKRISLVHEFTAQDGLTAINDDGAILIGALLAERLGVKVGDTLTLIVPGSGGVQHFNPTVRSFTVGDIFTTGTEMDRKLALIALPTAMQMMDSHQAAEAQGVGLKIHNVFHASLIAQFIADTLGENYRTQHWMNLHGNLFNAIQMSKRMVFLIVAVIIVVAAFNLISTQVMIINDKRASIAIIRTMGASQRQIFGIFAVQSGSIIVLGTLLGGALGSGLSLWVSDIADFIQRYFGAELLHAEVYPINYLPSHLEWSQVALVLLAAVTVSLCAAIYPALRAARIIPVRVLSKQE